MHSLLMAREYIIVHMYHNFFYPFICQGTPSFHVLVLVNTTAMNIGVHVSFSIMVFSGYMPSRGLLGHMVVLFLVF